MAMSTISNAKRGRFAGHVRPLPPDVRRDSIGFVSTFPPTKCGLATFTASLAGALSDDCRIGVVSCVDEPGETACTFRRSPPSGCAARALSLAAASRVLDDYDAVIVQHEFGLFGGADGADIVELVNRLDTHVIVVLHTVLETPSPNQRRIVERLAALASKLVVQSEVARIAAPRGPRRRPVARGRSSSTAPRRTSSRGPCATTSRPGGR